jgi:hypothetical protein
LVGGLSAQPSESIPETAETAAPKQDLGSAMQNPIGAIYSVPIEVNTDFGAENGDATFIQFQPVYPFSLGEWNMVNRTIIPFIDAPGGRPGSPGNPSPEEGERTFGLGDIMHTSFFSPAKAGKLIWGIGPVINLPTATSDVLGSGKWSAGPSIVLLTTPKPWVFGCLLGNMWSFAGDDDRADVNQLFLQPFITYNMEKGWFLTTSPIITANWNADSGQTWMVPLGGGVGRQFKLGGKIASQFMVQYFYNVAKPDGAPDSSLRFTFQMAFPK